ncbi:ABC transporter substrate-binding protein [Blastococcus sp. CT_GayMR20]|uniref:ABC transporter substrate-binding protein n=1 Tax=Blastococcus sp. CT_GayMR20 TaxID=2559609 RepID=UPI001073DE3E|nr:ABC transporter substrate-binding protein [Blastococcus sp. CT_GayMR20]TFV83112.1 ABC transporter substrate-binding protein [Blastococcus sp. CT_GayMR20]
MSKLRLSLACWDYDRTRAIQDGRVQPDGIDLNFIPLRVEEIFFRQLRHREFDVAEMSLSSYVMTLSDEKPPFIAIPVFPSKFFRHGNIYINRNSGIDSPADLVGKKVGVAEFQMTAGVWQRGVLAEEYGVPVDSVTYWTGGVDQPGRIEKLPLDLPDNLSVTAIPTDRTLSDMLEKGEIDALMAAVAPSSFLRRTAESPVTRLFPDYVEVEQDYYRRTGIHHIMHTVVIRRDVYDADPWVAQSLVKAFEEAKQLVYADLVETGALKYMLPWSVAEAERTREIFGTDDFWSYGLEPNRRTLVKFLEYSKDQGLAKRHYEPEELFAPESLEAWKK